MRKATCDNCHIDKHLEIFANPYSLCQNLTLCQKCSEIPFGAYTNKEILKPWFEQKKSVKSFDASTLHPQAYGNFKTYQKNSTCLLEYATAGIDD